MPSKRELTWPRVRIKKVFTDQGLDGRVGICQAVKVSGENPPAFYAYSKPSKCVAWLHRLRVGAREGSRVKGRAPPLLGGSGLWTWTPVVTGGQWGSLSKELTQWKRLGKWPATASDTAKEGASCDIVAFQRVIKPGPPLVKEDREGVLMWQTSHTHGAGALGLMQRCKGSRHSYELLTGFFLDASVSELIPEFLLPPLFLSGQ